MANGMPGGFYPFWFWNDRLTPGEIRWQVRQMAEQGCRGFFVHSRQGLQQPYLSSSFIESVRVAISAAKEHGLLVYLYDEYPYPSGVAGGKVILGNPAYYATRLVHRRYVVEGSALRIELPRGQILACMDFPLADERVDWDHGIDLLPHVGIVLTSESYVETGLTQYNRNRYFGSDPTPVLETELPPGRFKVLVSAQVEVDHFKYWNHYVDVLHPEAIRRFIDLTHERYRAAIGEHFGDTVRGVFVDEVQPGWSPLVLPAFRERHGYDLLTALPALNDPEHPDHLRVSRDLYQIVYDLFVAAFEEPISRWCRDHKLLYVGEKASMRLSQLRYMDVPGCDPGHVKVGAPLDVFSGPQRRNAKVTASAAYFYGKAGALCECYHSTGWSATLQDAKYVADGLLLAGITYLVPHGFFYSTHALRKHDAPPSFFFQMPYWPLFHLLTAHVERVLKLFEGTHIDAEVLVVDPSSGLPSEADWQTYAALFQGLLGAHIDFLVVDTDVLLEGQVERGRVCVRDIEAGVVVQPPMAVIEPSLARWISEFERAGGCVIRCAQGDAKEAVRQVRCVVAPSLRIRADGQGADKVWLTTRKGDGRTLWFALNTGDETLNLELEADVGLEEVPLGDLPPALEASEGRVRRAVRPFESFALRACETDLVADRLPMISVPVGGVAQFRLEGPNLLRLGQWRMTLLEDDPSTNQSAVVSAAPLANQLALGEFRFAPAVRTYFGHVPELGWPHLRVSYEAEFESAYEGRVELVMEPGSIVGEWVIRINDGASIQRGDFGRTSAHVRGSLGVDVTEQLCSGSNRIRVELATDRPDGGLLNPLYLAGEFGVQLTPLRLVAPRSEGVFEDYAGNLIPFYAGVIEYTTEFTLDTIPSGEEVMVSFCYDQAFHKATTVAINKSRYRPLAWEPRRLVVPTSCLRAGRNLVRTRVHTSLVRPFEGQWFDYVTHRYRDVSDTP